MRVHRLLIAAMVACFVAQTSVGALAQDGGPRLPPQVPGGGDEPLVVERIDLAAIALDSNDLPAEFTLTFEAYLGGDDIASQLFADRFTEAEIEEIGLLWYYESQYQTADEGLRIRSYIEQFTDEDAVERGFDLLEDEGDSTSDIEIGDQAGFDGIGDDPAEITTFTYDDGSGTVGVTIDATFRVGALLMGVAIDSLTDEEPSLDDLEELAGLLEERAEAVLAGDDLPGIDPTLSIGLLDYGDALVIQEGYLALNEAITADPQGEDNREFVSGYTRMIVLGIDENPDLPLPFVVTSLYRFSTESTALGYLTGLETVTPAYAELERAEIGRIRGTDAARALSYVNPYDGVDADSLLLVATIGDLALSIEVVGAPSLDIAQETALALFAQQVPCVVDVVACGTASLPAGFAAAEG